jgi:hypothetical protein
MKMNESLYTASDQTKNFIFLSELEYELFQERAAILEFDAGLTRSLSEHQAWQAVLQYRKEVALRKAG